MFRCIASSLLIAAATLPLAAGGAYAAGNLVVNGNFSSLTNGYGEVVPGQTTGTDISSAPGWTSTSTSGNSGYPFLFFTNNAVSTGFGDAWDNNQQRYLWGAANGGANTWNGTSLSGGNYLVMDGDYHATAISQTVSTLVRGATYQLSFNWAAAQWYNDTGATTEAIQVSLGDQVKSTNTYSLPSTGFSGWMTTTMTFQWDGVSNVLSFLAVGGPSGLPPISLLDSVNLSLVPEPSSLVAMVGGLLIVIGSGVVHVRKRRFTA